MNYLFYSKKCIFSLNLLELIANENISDKFSKIDIDIPENKLKFQQLGFDKIPTIVTRDANTPLIGKVAFDWVNNKKFYYQSTNNINNRDKIINPKIISDVDKLAFNKNEINKISDNYTDIDDKDLSINKSQLSFNKIQENVPITNNNKIEFKIIDEKIGNNLDIKMQKYIENNELINRFNTDYISITNIKK
jgi:hypothetical protein